MPTSPTLLVLMARWPAPLRCKTRLARGGLGAVRAANLQRQLLTHTLAVVDQAAGQLGAAGRLALAGAGSRAGSRLLRASPDTHLVLQGEGSLGLRLQRQFATGFRDGFGRVVVVGSDLPQLAVTHLQQAVGALQASELVLGPAVDGGYWLLGLRHPVPKLFVGIDWGGPRVLAQTLEAARRLAVTTTLLGPQGDLDRCSDLQLWR